MYSRKERMKAVQLYIDSHFSAATVIHKLGYPDYKMISYVKLIGITTPI